MFLLKMSFRNVLRNPARTGITTLAVIAGVAMMIFGWGLIDGLDENVLRASATSTTGEVLLRPDGYPVDGRTLPLDQAVLPPDTQALIAALPEVRAVAPRAEFFGRLIAGRDASRVMGIAYDPVLDPVVFPRENWHIEGRWPQGDAAELVVGSRLLKLLSLKLGDSVFLEARTVDGAHNALTYTIIGSLTTDNSQIDALSVWLAMPSAEQLLLLNGRRTHIALLTDAEPAATAAALPAKIPGWAPRTVTEECQDLLELNDFRRRAMSFMVVIIMAIAATGITNSVLMAAFERVKEIGALRALGMTRWGVAAMFLLEGLALGLLAGGIGALIGGSAVLYWQEDGILLGEEVMSGAADMAVSAKLYTRFSWTATLGSVAFAVLISEIAVLYPTWFASQLNPADAVRAD